MTHVDVLLNYEKKKKTSVVRLFATSIPNEKRTVLNQFDRVEKSWKVNEYSTSVNDEDQYLFSRTEPCNINLIVSIESYLFDIHKSRFTDIRCRKVTTNCFYRWPL